MDSRQLYYFRVVVDERSFTRAADRLLMTQPSLSLSVRKLEKETGVRLLDRTPHGVEPTEAGRYLYRVAVQIGEQMQRAGRHLHDLAAGSFGRVSLSVAPEFNWGFLPAVISRLRVEAPDVELEIADPPPSETLLRIQEGRSELGLMITSDVADLERRYGGTLEVEQVRALPLILAVPDHLAHLPCPVSLTELAEESWLIPLRHPSFLGLPEILDVYWAENPGTRPHHVQRVNTLQTAIPLVAGGVGVALVTGAARGFANTGIHYLSVVDPPPPLYIALLYRRNAYLSPAAERLKALIQAVGRETS